jgi:hypothetical protein
MHVGDHIRLAFFEQQLAVLAAWPVVIMAVDVGRGHAAVSTYCG